MEFVIESVEDILPKHPLFCSSKPAKQMLPVT